MRDKWQLQLQATYIVKGYCFGGELKIKVVVICDICLVKVVYIVTGGNRSYK